MSEFIHVTEALSTSFGDQYAGIPADVLQHAAERGTAVHAACRYWDEGDLFEEDLSPVIHPYLMAWKAFLRDVGAKVVEAEVYLQSKKYQFCGTADRILLHKKTDRLGICDIKTTASISRLVALQTAGYAIAWNEMNHPRKIQNRCAVQLRDDGTYKAEWYHDDRMDRSVFLAALVVAQWKRKGGL